jgi:hypothetical protein
VIHQGRGKECKIAIESIELAEFAKLFVAYFEFRRLKLK